MPASPSIASAQSVDSGSVLPVPAVFLRLGDVMRITGLSRSTLYRLMADNGFPAPHRVGRRAVRWRSDIVAQWSAARPVTRR